MAITFKDVQKNAVTISASATITFSVDPVAGDSIIVLMDCYSDPDTFDSPNDDGGNTYTDIHQEDFIISANGKLAMWASLNIPTGGSSFDVTVNQPGVVGFLSCVAILVESDSPLAYNNDATGDHATGTPSSTITATPPSSSLFVAAAMTNGPNNAIADTSGFNATGVNGFTAGMLTNIRQEDNTSFQDLYGQYKISSAAQIPAWTGGPYTYAALIASFSETNPGRRYILIPN